MSAAEAAGAPAGAAPPAEAEPVRVMLCDDSAVVRGALARLLRADPAIRIVAQVGDGRAALAALADARPEVVLLDLEMPVMDGMTALPLLLRQPAELRPAVIVASALTQRGAAAAMAALRAGAADYLPKPAAAGGGMADPLFRAELLEKVKGWARIRRRQRMPASAPRTADAAAVARRGAGRPGPAPSGRATPRVPAPWPAGPEAATHAAVARRTAALPRAVPPPDRAAPPAAVRPEGTPDRAAAASRTAPRVVVIGASTGGPQALAALVRRLPSAPTVPVLVVQHMPPGFTAMLADHLGRLGGPPAAEAREGEPLRPGRLYLAPGDRHLLVEAGTEGALFARLSDGPAENFCRPALDPLLRSLVAACGGARLLVVVLTGMGQDGLAGCRAVAAAGGQVLAQDEASSVVWGMPGAVARAGLARVVAPPEVLAERIAAALSGPGPRAA
ncbi:chemotaxis response regulator protein-glutamate methylesterase of group 2 operon [Caldovatus sediminis]|uniref:Protein-glutamate methylesterase/protein-glutamine glutaminase n=1 Tax=Caldovatus sediminis TaxID=2041189 RepID=A0A8J2Z7E1_9PROT|nr:chemotaxis-specific protein-glutamate methyltransferase CheB [Caldovatus sediminis]GGG15935.1 chemotaxis response regulator protein-glutamate methylesterase of group 2 operon [Caldovatus sediminis]